MHIYIYIYIYVYTHMHIYIYIYQCAHVSVHVDVSCLGGGRAPGLEAAGTRRTGQGRGGPDC